MRSASPLIAAGFALAVAGQAFAASAPSTPAGQPATTAPPATSDTPSTAAPSTPSTTDAAPPATTSSQSAAPSAGSSGTNSSATAGGTAKTTPPSFTVGESVKDSSGANIGTISSLSGSGDAQMAVIKMGSQSFQVQANRLGSENGAAEINMTKAQIDAMLHSSAK